MAKKQLTLDEKLRCDQADQFPGDALDPDEVNYERVHLVDEEGEVEVTLRARGREVEFFERGGEYKLRFERVNLESEEE